MEKVVFNAEQQRVIEATGGYHLVLAPPGCGKTAVLAQRIAYALSQGVQPKHMACLTFTNRAARAMRDRIETLTPELSALNSSPGTAACNKQELSALFVGNVHRFCLHFLFDEHIVPEHAAVIDTDTSMSIIADYLGEDELRVLADNKCRQRYSQIINLQHLMHQCCHAYPSELIVHRESMPPRLLNELCNTFSLLWSRESTVMLYHKADHYLDEPARLSADARQMLQMLSVARQYEQYKQANDLLDFEDLLLTTYESLAGRSDLRRYQWLQVDEVQDLNPLQIAIIDSFTAPGATVVYLGDTQQAIFSFMGAKTDTLTMLRQQCGDAHFYNFYHNYRSPQYLLDIFNRYAQWQLEIDPALLPATSNHQPQQPGDVQLLEAPTNIDEARMVAQVVSQLYHEHTDESIAVVVAFNSDADEVSAALGRLPHFKISGSDFFATTPMRLMLAHMGVLAMEHNFIAWAQLLCGLKVYASNSSARQAVRAMMQLAIAPSDMLLYADGSTYVAEFVRAYEQYDMVVFDTETTGLDVFADDVVQIAAVRVRQGRVVDTLNLFIETDREIPPMLGDEVNPLVEEYRCQPHAQAAEALARFLDFASGAVMVGHNATYDYHIMHHNMRRRATGLAMPKALPSSQQPQASPFFDTLKLSHLLHPRQKSYKLRSLIEQLGLEGANTHLANDDIMATLSLMVHCYDCARSLTGRQMEFLSRHRQMAQRLRALYGSLYEHGLAALHTATDGTAALSPLAGELQYVYDTLTADHIIPQLPKFHYIIKYVEHELIGPGDGSSLAQQLAAHYSELCTLKEADLCGSASMTERVFVSTVHKAKGLEFDTVVVYDAVDGKFPSPYADMEAKRGEEARKFYVAMSRARRRLIVSYCRNAISRWGAWHAKVLTPYMKSIISCFQQ